MATYQDIFALNTGILKDPNKIYPGQVLTMPDGSTYTVSKGDNLSSIAANYTKTVANTTDSNTLTKDEQAVLEAYQADNRAQLVKEESATPVTETVPTAPAPTTEPAVSSPEQTSPYGEANDPYVSPEMQQAGDDAQFEADWQASQDAVNKLTPAEQKQAEDQAFERDWAAAQTEVNTLTPEQQKQAEDQAFERDWAAAQNDYKTAPASDNNAPVTKPTTDTGNFKQADDWRVRLSLAPSANYLYKVAKSGDILFPLKATNGVIFPYLPQINVNYKANYDPTDLTHSNYKVFMYKNSAVDDVQITADFTAQDTNEANYMLAVIHFFKSVTKMFYGQDGKSGPRAGTPPPLVYLSGLGAYQFDNHPMVINSFALNLPNDVDYVRAGVSATWGGQSITPYGVKEAGSPNGVFGQMAQSLRQIRLDIGNLKKGAQPKEPQFKSLSNTQATYVPTKIQIQLSASPVVSRNDISNNFSLTDYATGKLLRGSQRSGGGIW